MTDNYLPLLLRATGRRHNLRRLVPLLALVLTLLLTGTIMAQDAVTDDEVNAVARTLYCPICESTPLDVCPTQACVDWRNVIRTQLSEGRTEEQIQEYFALQYGDQVLATPPTRGLSLFIWPLPLVAVPIGAIFFVRYMRAIKKPDHDLAEDLVVATGPAAPADLSHYIEEIEAELNDE